MPNSIESPSNSVNGVDADDRKNPNTEALDIAGAIYCMGFEDSRDDFADSLESCIFGARLITDLVNRKIAETEQCCKDLVFTQTNRIAELGTERDEWKTKCETREFAYKQADAERKRYSEQIDELQAERDEWKAKYKLLLRALDGKTYVLDFWKDGDTCHVITTDGEEIYNYQKWLEDRMVVFEK